MTRHVLIIGYRHHPSTRLRLLAYLPGLERSGFKTEVSLLHQGASPANRRVQVAALEPAISRADVVLVQRILSDQLNSLLHDLRKPVVFDIDDALHYVRPESHALPAPSVVLARQLKRGYRRLSRGNANFSSSYHLLRDMSRLAHTVVAGNFWLRDELAETVRKIIVIPTTVPVREDLIKLAANTLPLQIGWIGLKDNFRSLRLLDDAFALLGDRHPGQAQLTVVSSEPYRTTSIKTRFLPWSVERERTDVAQFDIGIMPLEDHPFVNGKCAFKAILCMAHGIPVVATPVGVNVSVIGHGRNGFLAETTDEWVEHLSSLVSDVELRRSLGSAALETVRTDFNFDCGLERLAAVLDAAADS